MVAQFFGSTALLTLNIGHMCLKMAKILFSGVNRRFCPVMTLFCEQTPQENLFGAFFIKNLKFQASETDRSELVKFVKKHVLKWKLRQSCAKYLGHQREIQVPLPPIINVGQTVSRSLTLHNWLVWCNFRIYLIQQHWYWGGGGAVEGGG